MTANLHVLYEATILEHSRHPRNRRAIEGGARAERHNPMCGDRVTVFVRLDGDVIRDVSFEGSACAIVIAAASLMTEAVRDQTTGQADAMFERLRRLLTQPGDGEAPDIGPLAALAGVRQFPLRVKCACLPWQALQAAVAGSATA